MLTDEQAAVIDKLKLPLLNMTSSLQQMQSKNMRMASELRSVCHLTSHYLLGISLC
jgi:hypothetical protein